MLSPGDLVPDCAFQSLDKGTVRLSEFGHRILVVIFLRHGA